MKLVDIFIVLTIIWLLVLLIAILTLTRRKDIGMPLKAFWSAVLFMAPVVGLIFYLIYGFKRRDNDIVPY